MPEERVWTAAPSPEAADRLSAAGHPPWLARLLARRGLEDPEAAAAFLAPELGQLHPPALLAGLGEALDRLERALGAGERVAVVGDYDVDGISATALLVAVFRACGLEAEPILPRRLDEGYGFQPIHVERARAAGCGLIVTADCGIGSHAAIDAARAAGLDVVVTDHHLPAAAGLPRAVVVNPRRDDCDYPFPDLAGAGLAFKLASALAERRGREIDPLRLLGIACLGTICDLVPLVGENRVIAALGLRALAETRSRGLQELMRRAGLRRAPRAVDVGFRIGPRLNAAGRLEAADPALELLLTTDAGRAAELAERLEELNTTRRAVEARVVEEARRQLDERPELEPILVAWSADWHPGVLGIAAGRIARELHRPTLLLAVDDAEAKGSGRSIPGIHLHGFLSAWRDRLTRFGGHAQAVGLSAAAPALGELAEEWREAAAAWDPAVLRPVRVYDEPLAPAAIDHELLAAIERLEPFGIGNPRPRFRVGPLALTAAPRLFGQGHAGFVAAGPDGERVDLVGWGWGERGGELAGEFEVLATVDRDDYLQRPVLRLIDARSVGGADAGPSVQSRP